MALHTDCNSGQDAPNWEAPVPPRLLGRPSLQGSGYSCADLGFGDVWGQTQGPGPLFMHCLEDPDLASQWMVVLEKQRLHHSLSHLRHRPLQAGQQDLQESHFGYVQGFVRPWEL